MLRQSIVLRNLFLAVGGGEDPEGASVRLDRTWRISRGDLLRPNVPTFSTTGECVIARVSPWAVEVVGWSSLNAEEAQESSVLSPENVSSLWRVES